MSKEKEAAPVKGGQASLYRAYRPRSFGEVRGQEHIVTVLKNAIERGTVGHAYLFAGTRGTGKTSIARIFARELGVSEKDLYEIDAASHTGVDDIRELRDGVYGVPFESPYKVYLIDEAHMLSRSAFNALLKTLEEPPAHAIFILATTELHKIPDTIQSRCETYLFRQPSRALLVETVTAVAKSEGSSLEAPAAELIATLAEGSFRDALGVLQKALTVAKKGVVTRQDVETVSGAPREALIEQMLRGIAGRDAAMALGAAERIAADSMDTRVVTKLLMDHVRAVLLLRYVPAQRERLQSEFSAEMFATLTEMAGDRTPVITSATLRALLAAYADMANAVLPHVPLELALIDLAAKPDQSAAPAEVKPPRT